MTMAVRMQSLEDQTVVLAAPNQSVSSITPGGFPALRGGCSVVHKALAARF